MSSSDWTTTSTSNTRAVFSTTSSTSGGNSSNLSYYKKDTTNLATISTWSFHTIISCTLPNSGITTRLVDITNANTSVTGTVSHKTCDAGGTGQYNTGNFSDGAAGFTSGDEFQFMASSDVVGQSVNLNRAWISVKLTGLTKSESWYRIGKSIGATDGEAFDDDPSRAVIDSTRFSTPTFYYEATGKKVNGAGGSRTEDCGTSDLGACTGGFGASVAFTATKATVRSASFTPVDGDRYDGTGWAGAGASTITSNGFIVVQNQ